MSQLSIIERPRLLEHLSNHRHIALSACHGAGKTELLRQFASHSDEDALVLTLLPSHNDAHKLVAFLRQQLDARQWLGQTYGPLNNFFELTAAFKNAQRSYRAGGKKVIVLDQCERLTCAETMLALAEFLYGMSQSIRIIISGANQALERVCTQKLGIDWYSLNNKELKFDDKELNIISSEYSFVLAEQVADLYQLSAGHCQTFAALLKLMNQLPRLNLKQHAAQLSVVEDIYLAWLDGVKNSECQLFELPVLCRYLFNLQEIPCGSFSELSIAVPMNSTDNVHFELPELFRYWFIQQYRSGWQVQPEEKKEILLKVCEYYCQSGYSLQAVELLAEQGHSEQAAEILIKQLLMLIRVGNYHDAGELYQKIDAQLDTSAQLLLFGVLIDFQRHGHLYALNRLNSIDVQAFSHQELRSYELFKRHCQSMLDIPGEVSTPLSIGVNSHWPLLCWDTHTLATEQLYQGLLLDAETHFLLSLEQAHKVGDIPCLLANLSWLYVTHLRTDKLNQYQDLVNEVERILINGANNHLPAFQGILNRLKVFWFIENGEADKAALACTEMKSCYSSLDPLNRGYCLWAEFLLRLVQGDDQNAKQVLAELAALNVKHYGKWSLALPDAELFKALLNNEDDMAVLRWANRYEQRSLIENLHSYDRQIAECFGYLRIRITLGSDMSIALDETDLRIAAGDALSRLHWNILTLLNHDRQGKTEQAQQAMDELLIAYSCYSLRGVYMEYQQSLLLLMQEYKPVPSLLHYWQDLLRLLKSKSRIQEQEEKHTVAMQSGLIAEQHPVVEQLSARESEVLVLLLQAKSNAQIASALNLSEATIKGHVGRLLKKFELNNRSQLIALQPL